MTAVLAPDELIDADLWERLVSRIMADEGVDRTAAGSAMAAGLAFLARCATAAGPQSPTPEEDLGWHTFILHTRDYAAFCDRIAGRFIHHEPTGQGCIDDGGSSCSSKCISIT
jgi:hypothetical protein